MSTIDTVSRQRLGYNTFTTRVKVYVHSHQMENLTAVDNPIKITNDVVSFTAGKSISGAGVCSLTLVPRYNYLNILFPNDYINVYIDRGDGEGWTRVFFGFIDRVAEDSKVDESGTPQTLIKISCTDFSKLFDKTNIYFNPQLAVREDLQGNFIGALNIGGSALRTKGVTATGAPTDMILNMIFVLLGAGSQFVMPPGYTSRTKSKFRKQRAEFAIKRLENDLKTALPDGGAEIIAAIEARQDTEEEPEIGREIDINSTQTTSLIDQVKLVAERSLEDRGIDSVNKGILNEVTAVLQTSASSTPLSFLDILDVFTFVEREAIDGYVDGVSVWQKQGTLMSFLKSHANAAVNEMFFDLRPMTQDSSEGLTEGEWDRTSDEIDGNTDDTLGTSGIRFVPALVMREYPFSTIDAVDGSNITLNLKPKDARNPIELGRVQMGSIFNDKVNVPGRHLIEVPNINVEDRAFGRAQNLKAKKHIDVAVINSRDVFSYSWGRSDHDHFNLTEFTSDSYLGADVKFFMQEFLPIITPIHIARHGLRVRTISTRFARFGILNIPKITQDADEEPEDTTEEKEVEGTGDVLFPHGSATPTKISPYGYRRRNAGDDELTFHHGIDLYLPIGTPVQSTVDGEVVAVMPSGNFSSYGNVIVVKHNKKYKGKTVFSFYAHLDTFNEEIVKNTNPNRRANRTAGCSASFYANGKMPSYPVKAGAPLGTTGNTAGTRSNPSKTFDTSEPHLHFEIMTAYPAVRGGPPPVAVEDLTGLDSLLVSTTRSFDPVIFFAEEGSSGNTDIIGSLESTEENPEDGGDSEEVDDDQLSPPREDEDENTPESSTKPNNVDSGATRIQIGRWALLNDHWYQHNLEYLSGTIVMRGAPEIRVGYRLDFEDKNLSFYVEGVQHSWSFPGKMETTLSVTRGQPNNPFPLYVLPANKKFSTKENQRRTGSRLGEFTVIPDSLATIRSTSFNRKDSTDLASSRTLNDDGNSTELTDKYDEDIIEAGTSFEIPAEQDLVSVEELLAGDLSDLDTTTSSSVSGTSGKSNKDS